MTRIGLGIFLVVACLQPSLAATVGGKLMVEGQPAGDAVVYLESSTPPESAPPAGHVVMDQKNLQFVPKVLPIVRGTTVDFINSDDIQHNVFSPSELAGRFDLGAYGPGAARTVTFRELGEVLVLCNIHMEMEAHIVVLPGRYFSLVTADGTYRIQGVPPGSYSAKVWYGRFMPQSRAVDVPTAGDVNLDWDVDRQRNP